jgi:hypothetical protein
MESMSGMPSQNATEHVLMPKTRAVRPRPGRENEMGINSLRSVPKEDVAGSNQLEDSSSQNGRLDV